MTLTGIQNRGRIGPVGGLDEAALVGHHDELGAVAGVQLHHRSAHVGADRGRADDPLRSDLVVGQALGDQRHDLPLPVGEAGQRRRAGLAATRSRRELGDQAAGDARREQGLPGSNDVDGPHQLRRLRVLDEEAGGASSQRVEDVLVELERREDQHLDVSQLRIVGDRPGRLQAIDTRHADVHQHDVGTLPAHELQRRRAVAGLADDLDIVLDVEQHPKPGAHELLVVGDDDADHARLGHETDTANPPPGRGPIVLRPPVVVARSRMPCRPRPPLLAAATPRP